MAKHDRRQRQPSQRQYHILSSSLPVTAKTPTNDQQSVLERQKKGRRSDDDSQSKATEKVSKLLLKPNPYWYDDILVAAIPDPSNTLPLSESEVAAKQALALRLLEEEGHAYATSGPRGSATPGMTASDATFLSRVLTSGTLSDRLSALTLMVQASPMHNIKALETLKGMAGKKNREESLKAIRAITDWWVGGGAPPRKLKSFRDQPLSKGTERHLLVWCFEDWLKKYFFSVLQLLEVLLLDSLPYVRTQAMNTVAILLKEKPEQEQNLLRLLVNKLGDPERVIASKASFHLLQILQSHPGMKAVVIREASSLLSRPVSSSQGGKTGENRHARYYAVITFNQIALTPSDTDLARHLVDVYFGLFREILGSRPVGDNRSQSGASSKRVADKRKPMEGFSEDVDDEQSKMIAAVLTGVNRALPFAALEQAILDAYVDVLFRITHSATFNISVQALVLVFHVMSGNEVIADRFYRTLYESLLDARLLTSSKRAMYLNLLFRAMKTDASTDRTAAMIRRLMHVLHLHQPPFICGTIYLLGELMTSKPELRGLLSDPVNPRDSNTTAYDPRKRDPKFAQASDSPMWEIAPLAHHFHPSVSLHARQLADGSVITANADLSLNTVIHFLDRFVYRNPKKPTAKGPSAMQPGRSGAALVGVVRPMKGARDDGVLPTHLTSLSGGINSVPVDQLFFYQYFHQRSQRGDAKKDKIEKRKKKVRSRGDGYIAGSGDGPNEDSGVESQSSEAVLSEEETDEEEEEIWQAMKASMPQTEGDGDVDDSDDDLQEEDDSASTITAPDQTQDGALIVEGGDALDVSSDEEGGGEDDFFDFEEEQEDLLPVLESGDRKRKSEDGEPEPGKRRKRSRLPMFASYDDYATLIEGQPDDNL